MDRIDIDEHANGQLVCYCCTVHGNDFDVNDEQPPEELEDLGYCSVIHTQHSRDGDFHEYYHLDNMVSIQLEHLHADEHLCADVLDRKHRKRVSQCYVEAVDFGCVRGNDTMA